MVGELTPSSTSGAEEDHQTNMDTSPQDSTERLLNVKWFEEQLEADLKWSFAINRVLHRCTSQYQEIAILDTERFGKVLIIDEKLQSAEADEYVYHESLVHPSLLLHEDPRMVFIMGGGEGSAAREVLKHKTVEKVVMCDIDKDVVDFCKMHLTENREAFDNPKLHVVINDAKAELERRKEKFDLIIGDLADPIKGGPCNGLYTKSFYEKVIKPRLTPDGIFVTQAGLAGVLSHKDMFSPIYNTMKQVFEHVIAYTAHVPSYADSCGWVLGSDRPLDLDVDTISGRIEGRVKGELRYLDGAFIVSSTVLHKTLHDSLLAESRVFTEENLMFAHGHGIAETGLVPDAPSESRFDKFK